MSKMGRYLASGLGVMMIAGQAAAAAPDEAEVSIYREEPRSYAGASVVQFNLESDIIDQQPGGLMARMGGRLGNNFGAEVRLGGGFWHEAQRDGLPTQVKKVIMDVDYVAGAYFTGRWGWQIPYVEVPLIKQFYFDVQAGLAAVQVSAEAETFAGLDSEEDWRQTSPSFGAGLGMDIDLPILGVPAAAGLQYMNYGALDDVPGTGDELDVTSLEATLQIFF